jgi:hypothetical protein
MDQSSSSQQEWFKSSLSTGGNCVEVKQGPDGTAIRHSRNPDGAVLLFTRAEWDAFTGGVRLGEFDRFAAS